MEYILKKTNEKIITVRDVQLILLKMMKDIHNICNKHQITYFLEGGSALGAYRHGGFIPWDDDFDISMMYEDYLRFIKVLEKELDSNEYIFHCYEKNDKYNVLIPAMKIRKKNTFIKEKNKLLENKIDDCDGLFIDVFVYDWSSRNKYIDFFNRALNHLLMPVIILFENININPRFLKNFFVQHARNYGKKNRNSGLLGIDLCWTFNKITKPYRYKEDVIFPVKLMKFEDKEFYVPNKIEDFLEVAIGKNYHLLPSENQQKPKHIEDIEI